MKFYFHTNPEILKYYFHYQVFSCINTDGVFELKHFKNRYYDIESFCQKVNTFFEKNRNYFKKSINIEYVIYYIKNSTEDLYPEISKIFCDEYEKYSTLLEKIKINIQESTRSKIFLEKVSILFGVDINTIGDVDISLNFGGKEDFVSGLTLPVQYIQNRIFLNCSQVKNINIIENTLIHEVCHVFENKSDINQLACNIFNNFKSLKTVYKPIQGWRNFIFEIIITAIAGQNFSIYSGEEFKDFKIKSERGIIIYLSNYSKYLVSDYFKKQKTFDKDFFMKLFEGFENNIIKIKEKMGNN